MHQRLKTRILRAAMAALALLAGSEYQTHAEKAAPCIEFGKTVHDFGKVQTGEKVKYTFKFKNTGDADLHIEKISTSCGCTAALAADTTVPPGEGSGVNVEFDTAGRRQFQTKTITVQTNDPKKGKVKLKLQGTAIPVVDAEPNYVNFSSNLPKGAGAVQEMKIFTTHKESFEVTGIHSNVPEVVVEARKAFKEEKRHGYVFRVRLVKKARPDTYSGKLTVRIKHPTAKVKVLDVPFYGKVRGSVAPSPAYFNFGNTPVGEAATRSVTLRHYGEAAFRVTSVSEPNEHLSHDLSVKDGGKQVEIRLTVAATAPTGRLQGKVIVVTNLPEEKKVEIPIYGFVVKPKPEPKDAQGKGDEGRK